MDAGGSGCRPTPRSLRLPTITRSLLVRHQYERSTIPSEAISTRSLSFCNSCCLSFSLYCSLSFFHFQFQDQLQVLHVTLYCVASQTLNYTETPSFPMDLRSNTRRFDCFFMQSCESVSSVLGEASLCMDLI